MDDEQKYDLLTERLKEVLPIKAYPSIEIVTDFRDKYPGLTLKTEFEVVDIYNSKEITGIICVIETKAIKGFACALTLLNIPPNQPYYKEIIDYQRKRIKKLRRQERTRWN